MLYFPWVLAQDLTSSIKPSGCLQTSELSSSHNSQNLPLCLSSGLNHSLHCDFSLWDYFCIVFGKCHLVDLWVHILSFQWKPERFTDYLQCLAQSTLPLPQDLVNACWISHWTAYRTAHLHCSTGSWFFHWNSCFPEFPNFFVSNSPIIFQTTRKEALKDLTFHILKPVQSLKSIYF